jgi:hypothetical protein
MLQFGYVSVALLRALAGESGQNLRKSHRVSHNDEKIFSVRGHLSHFRARPLIGITRSNTYNLSGTANGDVSADQTSRKMSDERVQVSTAAARGIPAIGQEKEFVL